MDFKYNILGHARDPELQKDAQRLPAIHTLAWCHRSDLSALGFLPRVGLGFRDVGFVGFWDVGLLGFRDVGLLGFRDVGFLGFWDVGLLGFRDVGFRV